MQDQRVDEGIRDQVVFSVGGTQKVAAVVEIADHSVVLVWMVRVKTNADVLYDRVDLNSIDSFHAISKRVCQVVAPASTDYHDVLKRRCAALSLEQMNQGIGGAAKREGHHCLMTDIVDDDYTAHLVAVDSVVRGPTCFVPVGRINWHCRRYRHDRERQDTWWRQGLALVKQ